MSRPPRRIRWWRRPLKTARGSRTDQMLPEQDGAQEQYHHAPSSSSFLLNLSFESHFSMLLGLTASSSNNGLLLGSSNNVVAFCAMVLCTLNCWFSVTMQAQQEAPLDMKCKDKFLVQSAIVSQDITPKDISGDMFTKESGNVVDEVRLKVVYALPLQSTSINEGYDQRSLGSLSYQETKPFYLWKQQENLQNQKQ